MKLFPDETFLVYRTHLVWDVFLLMYWDLDYFGKPECVGQFVRIGKMDPLPLKTPLLVIRPPRIEGVYDKRELASIIDGEVERKRPYLDRMWERLRRQMETLIRTGKPYYEGKTKPAETNGNTELSAKLAFLLWFLFGRGGDDGGEEKKRPP